MILFLKFIDQTGEQKHFRTVEIEGLDWTKERRGRVMKIKFRVWDKVNNRMIKPKKFATVIPVLDFNG